MRATWDDLARFLHVSWWAFRVRCCQMAEMVAVVSPVLIPPRCHRLKYEWFQGEWWDGEVGHHLDSIMIMTVLICILSCGLLEALPPSNRWNHQGAVSFVAFIVDDLGSGFWGNSWKTRGHSGKRWASWTNGWLGWLWWPLSLTNIKLKSNMKQELCWKNGHPTGNVEFNANFWVIIGNFHSNWFAAVNLDGWIPIGFQLIRLDLLFLFLFCQFDYKNFVEKIHMKLEM